MVVERGNRHVIYMILKGLDYHVEEGEVDPEMIAKIKRSPCGAGSPLGGRGSVDHQMEVEELDIHMVLRGSRGSGTAYRGGSR